MNMKILMTNTKLLGIIAIAFLAGTVTSGAVAFADKDEKNPFSAALGKLSTALNNEVTRATGAEQTLTTSLGNEVTDRKQGDANTLSSANVYTDTQLAAADANLQNALNNEIAVRKQGDADTLSSANGYTDAQSAAEAAARAAADNNLQNALNNEIATRKQVETLIPISQQCPANEHMTGIDASGQITCN